MPELAEQVQRALDLNQREKDPARAAFVERTVKFWLAIASKLQGAELSEALSASNDLEVVLRALEQPGVAEVSEDPLAAARARGIQARDQLLKAEGGLVTGAVAGKKFLRLSRQAVDKRRSKGQLLGVELGKRGYLYPVWQFEGRGVLEGLPEVLAALDENGHSDLSKLIFFLSELSTLDGRRALDLLRAGDVSPVLRAARMFGEHGAA